MANEFGTEYNLVCSGKGRLPDYRHDIQPSLQIELVFICCDLSTLTFV